MLTSITFCVMVQEKLGQDTKLWIVTYCIFGCFHNSIFHFDYFKITSSHLIHRWYKLPFFQHLRTRTKKFQLMSVYFMSVLHGSCLVVVLLASSLNLNNGPSFLCQCQKHVHVSSFFVCLSVCVISQSPGILAQSSSTHRRIVVGMCVCAFSLFGLTLFYPEAWAGA